METKDRRMKSLLLLLLVLFSTCYCQNVPVINTAVVHVREDLPKGEFAFKIDAFDADSDPLTYGVKDNNYHFRVSKTTGDVYINNTLNREVQNIISVEVTVSDGVYAETMKTISVIVEDANDNAPEFKNTPYNKKVPENTPVHSTILTVLAIDLDDGPAGHVSYSIHEVQPTDGARMFSISNEGHIKLNEPLNFTDKSAFYQIIIIATDGGGPLYDNPHYVQSSNTTAFITVVDVPDLDPQFLNLPNMVTVNENSSVGTSVFKVQARDPDTGINDIIWYSIADTNEPDLFQINENDGVVSIKTVFDREALLHNVVQLMVKATETKLNVDNNYAHTTAKLDITIGDLNDNAPLFNECTEDQCFETNTFTGSINEHSVGLSVTGLNMRVKDKDLGENSRFNLHLEGPDQDAFSVSPVSGSLESNVLIQVKNPNAVDYEKTKTMTVKVIATDASIDSFVSTATVTIQIMDINDNFPQFEKKVYELSVHEKCPNGTIVSTVTATDEDALDDGLLTYKLLPESMLPFFNVFLENGTIFVQNGDLLDWGRRASYSPTLQAQDSEGNTGSAVLEISIIDINNKEPQFLRDYKVFIEENNELQLQVEATDADDPETINSKIQYSIVDSTYSTNFTVDPDTGMIRSTGILDREAINPDLRGVITLNVTATDMGVPPLSSWVKAIINVDDVNDNTPYYLDPDYIFHVNESEKGIFVGFVQARDADQTEYNNRTSFRFTGSGQSTFLCGSASDGDGYKGIITVDPAVELDYESERKSYTLTVEAADLAQHSATVTVRVDVVDINDTPPIFPVGLTMSVVENSPPMTVVGQINGTDLDGSYLLIYEFVSTQCHCAGAWEPCANEWFLLDALGVVRTSPDHIIDHEECDRVDLTARVVDLYTQKGGNSTQGVVTINIVDVNDNAPEFIPVQEFFVLLAENIELESSVADVRAQDKDSGENKNVTFKVTGVDFASSTAGDKPNPVGLIFFAETIKQPDANENYNGIIRSLQTLDSDKKGKYLVKVMAINGELSTEETLELITVDKSFRVSLRFDSTVAEVNKNLPEIRSSLTGATKAKVDIVKVLSETENVQRKTVTLVEAYFVFPNGTALDSESVGKILNSQEVYEEYGVILQQYGLRGILKSTFEPPENRTELFIMIGLVGGLVIVLAVTVTSLVCIKTNYKRKLKAAKAMNSAALVSTESQKAGPVVPGTNMYTREGANPVLNLNFDTSTDLGFNEETSCADQESLNSLDYNMDMTDKDNMPVMVIQEEQERGDSPHIEPLGAALAQRGQKKSSESPGITIANPLFSSVDL
ncbi:cadherin-related family member 2 [Electrophorus electricus]|uniref:cadherin-related family member 2 n=1 Tax=Electrophorus electricus TaxID=8005 RepID=UPI0015D07634|nr:cadherin-related family member 2 [Electrophorus electricus]